MNPCRRGMGGRGGGRGVEGDMSQSMQVPQANSSTINNIYSHFILVKVNGGYYFPYTDRKLIVDSIPYTTGSYDGVS